MDARSATRNAAFDSLLTSRAIVYYGDVHPRSVASIESAARTLEGDGFPVRRALSCVDEVGVDCDPFLLLDEIGPVEWQPGQAVGAGDQPRCGFESVTYLLSGELDYRDSMGNCASLAPGGLHWLNAGAGVVHAEEPSRSLVETGGRIHGFSLWVNLPRRAKARQPQFRSVPSAGLPTYRVGDGASRVRVLVGECAGLVAPVRTETPLILAHVTVAANETVQLAVPRGFSSFAYVFGGEAQCGQSSVTAGQLARLEADGDGVELQAGQQPADVLLCGGRPIREPVARYGSFVMTTTDEIVEAFDDYRAGRLGARAAAGR